MKNKLQALLKNAIESLQNTAALPANIEINIQIERCRNPEHGDFATNVAMILAKTVGQPPREIATLLINQIEKQDYITKIDLAGPGFINFTLSQATIYNVIPSILAEQEKYGHATLGKDKKVIVEFVSANPTGPLHVGHGRGAAYGACISDLLETIGFNVTREYYVNDAGRQMNILAVSIWLRYLELLGIPITFPGNAYRGDYIITIAKEIEAKYGKQFVQPENMIFSDLPPDEGQPGGDKEAHIDALIDKTKILLGELNYQVIFEFGIDSILSDIREDLSAFGIHYQTWYSERALFESGMVEKALNALQKTGYVDNRKGAEWFRSTEFGDDKDRVIVRDNGQPTYFASDIAHHYDRLKHHYDQIINVFGADHHGYITRIKTAAECLGATPNQLIFPVVQFAVLYRGTEQVKMSTRKGEFVTLRQLREEVGNDAARFFYVMRKVDQHMNFDLELAKSQSQDNPVYYVQYAHARICSVFRQLKTNKLSWDQKEGEAHLHTLTNAEEVALINKLNEYKELIATAALNYAPHLLAQYLRELATALHGYYNAHQFLVEESTLRNARLCLINATRHILANGLKLLGVSAPEKM